MIWLQQIHVNNLIKCIDFNEGVLSTVGNQIVNMNDMDNCDL